ncbi:MAG: alpha/beta fold hydrolase [Oxalobacteraceae bacterium]|jgi:proline iminopeptidase|nr:alpha/beta fold hydrolase [Oxalobacteraceae bacterium]
MPPTPPNAYDQFHLPAGDRHALYVAQYGQPDGPATVVLHGGPGSGTQPSVLEWFDLSRQRVVLFDQRGAGRSTPLGEITHNDSQALVADIELLRKRLNISRWMVVGGSWGATLALMYAGAHKEHISALVLRGSFLASAREMQWFFQSLKAMVPQGWAALVNGWSEAQKNHVLATLTQHLLRGTDKEQHDAAMRWAAYEDSVMQAMNGKLIEAPSSGARQASERVLAKYRLQAHYLSQGCFTSEHALLDIASGLKHLPVALIHGTHDLVCPPENAVRLAAAMPHARIFWVTQGGHTPADPGIAAALRTAIQTLNPP